MKIKRLFARMTSLALCFSMLAAMPVTAEDSPPGEGGASLSNSDISVTGTNSFGQMLAGALDEKAAEQTDGNGCNVFSVEMNGQTAAVELQTTQDCTLVIAIYEDDGVKMLDSVMKEVTEEDKIAEIMFENPLPEHYYLRAFLVDSVMFRPLSPVHTDPMHTAEMQEFLAKTTDDFDSDRVLNLDEDKTSNFAVYNDGVVILDNEDGSLKSADDASLTYVFENVSDEFKGLKQGDTFAYGAADDLLIVCVDSIEISGDTVTVRGADTEMDKVFDYIKIDTEMNDDDFEIKEPLYEKASLSSNIQSDNMAVLVERKQNAFNKESEWDPIKKKCEFEEKWTNSKDNGNGYSKKFEGSGSLSGKASFTVAAKLKLYLSWKEQYIEFKLEIKGELDVAIDIKGSINIPLGVLGANPLPGLILDFTPTFVIEGEIKIDYNATITWTLGRKAGNEGKEDFCKKPVIEGEVKVEGTLYIGLKLKPRLKVISEKVVNVTLEASMGVELKITLSVVKATTEKMTKKHTCAICLNGDIKFKGKLSAEGKLFNKDWLTVKGTIKPEFDIGSFYYSQDHDEWGWGSCPYNKSKLTIWVVNENGDYVPGAEIILPEAADTYRLQTNAIGYAETWIKAGNHKITATKDGATEIKSVKVKDDAVKLKFVLKEDNSSETDSSSNTDSSSVSDTSSETDSSSNTDSSSVSDTGSETDPSSNTDSWMYDVFKDYCIDCGATEKMIKLLDEFFLPNLDYFNAYDYADFIEKTAEHYEKYMLPASMTLYGKYPSELTNEERSTLVNGLSRQVQYEDYCAVREVGAMHGIDVYYEAKYGDILLHANLMDYILMDSIDVVEDATLSTQSQNAAPTPLDTPEFTGLAANTVYNIYAMKDTAAGLDPENLMYINQYTTDENGRFDFKYGLKENVAVKWLAVPMAQEDISAAEVALKDLDYTGEEQYPEPVVTLDGETLVFGTDYYLEGDFAATEPGEYTLTICGTGLYGGKKSVTYKIRSSETLLGDLNGDSKIDVNDLVLMQKKVAGWKVELDETAADVNCSGNIDVNDLVLMQKKVAGWKVKFGATETAA